MKTLLFILALLFPLAAHAQKVVGSDMSNLRNEGQKSYSTNRQWLLSEYNTAYFRLTNGNNFPMGTPWNRPANNIIRPFNNNTSAVVLFEGTYQVSSLLGDSINYEVSAAAEDHTGAYDGQGYVCIPTLTVHFVGNSIVNGVGSSDQYNKSFPAVVRTMGWDLDQVYVSAKGVNSAQNDALMEGTAGGGNTTNAPYFGLRTGLTNVYVYFENVNQMSPSLGNASASYCATQMVAFSTRMRAAGWKFVAVCPTPYNGEDYGTKTLALRDLLISAQTTNAFDALVQIPNTMTNKDDATYYVDTIHPSDFGHATLATNVYAGILTAMAAGTPGPAPGNGNINTRTLRIGR